MSKEQRNKIKVIYGHTVEFGIHKYFDKTPRYVTFFREPFDRMISLYNFLLTSYDYYKLGNSPSINCQTSLLENGEVPQFERWLKLKKDNIFNMPMHQMLTSLKYSPENMEKFYFIGITENYNNDALFLYHKLGIKKFCADHNISSKFFTPTKEERGKIKKTSSEQLSDDYALYKRAIQNNKNFKKGNINYTIAVLYMKYRKFLALTAQKLYEISAILKKHSRIYTQFIKLSKKYHGKGNN